MRYRYLARARDYSRKLYIRVEYIHIVLYDGKYNRRIQYGGDFMRFGDFWENADLIFTIVRFIFFLSNFSENKIKLFNCRSCRLSVTFFLFQVKLTEKNNFDADEERNICAAASS